MNLNSVPKIDFRPGKAKIRKDTSNTFSLSLSHTHTMAETQRSYFVILYSFE